MWSTETDQTFPLSSVKPLDGLASYRKRCLEETRRACHGGTHRRTHCPVTGTPLAPLGRVGSFEYLRCPDTGSMFLAELPSSAAWAELLGAVSRYRHSRQTFHAGIARTRNEHVYGAKLEWIKSVLRIEQCAAPRVLEVATPPSEASALLQESGLFEHVVTMNEMEYGLPLEPDVRQQVGAAVLFESLDRVDDPVALLRAVKECLMPGGLIFVTALVSSGFDVAVLGLQNLYLYPPDRTNCFSLSGLEQLLRGAGFTLLEVSTPGVLDVEIVQTHRHADPALPLSDFERQLLAADHETQHAFQTFLQQNRMSSFARIIGKKP